MSSSSTAITDSRSPSPLTPEASDSQEPVAVQGDLDNASSWYFSMYGKMGHMQWAPPASSYHTPHKTDDNMMLRLDDLIEQDAYDDSPSPEFASSSGIASPDSQSRDTTSVHTDSSPLPQNLRPNPLTSSHNGPMSLTKPIPPPAPLTRKHDPSSLNQRVVYPSKDSCYNLPIMFPSIPEGGTKSRVETQIRVTVDLADPSSSAEAFKYDRIGAWKWLRLPHGTATKKRTRKQGKIDPDAEDVLQLAVSVTCASPPHNRVLSCSSCQAREAKRVAKKLAARVRPARSDSESGDGDGGKFGRRHQEDTTNIIQFNCAEILDFSTGSVVLPLRITCYCRHHREKVGFNVHLTMMDSAGRLIGSGMTKPIMITDDHKTTSANRNTELVPLYPGLPGSEWAAHPQPIPPVEARAPSRRKKEVAASVGAKPRHKPYDTTHKPKKLSRESSVTSLLSPSPSISNSSLPTRSPTPSVPHGVESFHTQDSLANAQPPPLQYSTHSSGTSSPDTVATPLDQNSDHFHVDVPSIHQPQPQPPDLVDMAQLHTQSQQQAPIPISMNTPTMSPQPHSMPYMLFDSAPQTSQSLHLQLPTIHRLIPNSGPMHGGIEVTVLGANFYPSIQLNCIFGDVAASSTQRWSDNTLVCILPPRATPGVVVVWFEGFPKMDDAMASSSSLFTYSDESDRALMELALQVVGLKMTGKIEDAKNVAMRIVGTAGSDNSGCQGDTSNMMQLASSSLPSTRDLRSLLLPRSNESSSLENRIVDFLSVLDSSAAEEAPSSIPISQAISYPSPVGQTLLHLATFLGFSSLVKFLIDHDIDVDARDRNGCTALHFAALVRSTGCARLLLEAGADREIVNSLGKIPQEVAPREFFDDIIAARSSDSEWSDSEDEEAGWGDGEEDAAEEKHMITLKRRVSQRALRRGVPSSKRTTPRPSVSVSRATTPPPIPPTTSRPDVTQEPKLTKAMEAKGDEEKRVLDAKQTASFMEKMFQRTFAQLPAPQLPHLPQLPGMVPWGALPQIPMVFPVFVPMMPGWPSFLGGDNPPGDKQAEQGESNEGLSTTAIRATQEWRATWEKWVALAVATTARQEQQQGEDMVPPPMYTAKPVEGEQTSVASTSASALGDPSSKESTLASRRPSLAAEIRPMGYDNSASVPLQEVDAFAYQPVAKQKQKVQKKDDRMLLWFWLPILILSGIWALHNGGRLLYQAMIFAMPPNAATVEACS